MAAKRKRENYQVQVARIRIETTVVEVKAEGDEAASRMAVDRAKRLPSTTWTIEPYDGNSYRPHVRAIVSAEELVAHVEEGGAATTREADIARQAAATRYMLLKANCDTAEGDVIVEPWLTVDHPDLLASDLCRAWMLALEGLGLTHMSDRLDDLAAGAKPTVSDKILFSPVQRRRRRKQ